MGLNKDKIKNILVRGTNWVGDALMTTPALAAVRDNFPSARVTVLAKEWVAPVYAEHPAVDEVIILDRAGRHRGMKGLLSLARELRSRRFDLAVLFQNAFEAALIVWLAGIPLRLGYNTDGRGVLLNRSVRMKPEYKQVHETEYYLRILGRSGLEMPSAGNSRPVFHISASARAEAQTQLNDWGLGDSFILGLAPGAAYGPAKQWPPQRFAAAADLILARKPGKALVFGSGGEAAAAAEVTRYLSASAIDLTGRTGLSEAAALIERCGLVLTNDSGLMHLAAAVNTPLVAVFGSTNPVTTSPVGEDIKLIRHEVECAPCLKPVCNQPQHRCMDLVIPEEVARAGLTILEEKGGLDR